MSADWTARTPAEKRKARRLEKQGKVRITEHAANYIGKRGLVVNRTFTVTPLNEAKS